MMSNPLRILLLEDNPTDAELSERVLRKAGIDFTSLRVETRAAFVAALDEFRPDIILADYNLPGFDGLQALAIVRERSPHLPYIFVSGAMGDERAAETIKHGATDFILKDRLMRLPISICQALEKQKCDRQRRETDEKFRKICESARDAIIMMGLDRLISFWNPSAGRIFGYSAEEAMGRELHSLIAPKSASAMFSSSFPHFQETGEGRFIGKISEVTALRKNGEEFPVELSVSTTNLDGHRHAIGIVRDITVRKQGESEIAEQINELRRWHETTLGREMRVRELKREVNELLGRAGQPPRYPSAESDETTDRPEKTSPSGRISGTPPSMDD